MASTVSGYIGQINPGNGTNYALGSTAYGVCDTAAATAAKVVDMTGFTLTTGATLYVKFTYSNTASSPTLNVNSTGAKSIRRNGIVIPGQVAKLSWNAGAVVCFTYDGTYWQMNNAADFNTIDAVYVNDNELISNTDAAVGLNFASGNNVTLSTEIETGYATITVSAADNNPIYSSLIVTLPNVSDSNRSFSVTNITANHVLIQEGCAYLSNPSAAGSDLTLTTGAGSITVSGTLTGTTDIIGTFGIIDRSATGTAIVEQEE